MFYKILFNVFILSLIFGLNNRLLSQAIQRFSDGKKFDSVVINNKGKNFLLKKQNLHDFKFENGSKVQFQNKLLDYVINKDTLLFFDKVKEIEEITINKNIKKNEVVFKNEKKRKFICSVLSNTKNAVFISNTFGEKSYIKSITFFVKNVGLDEGVLTIYIYENANGYPKDDAPLFTIKKNIKDINKGLFEIILPIPMKFSREGIFVSFYLRDPNTILGKRIITLNCNSDTKEFVKSDYTGNWSVVNFPSFQYKLTILQ